MNDADSPMIICVNGEALRVAKGVRLGQLLNDLDLEISHIALELNREIIPRSSIEETVLHANDNIEIVHFVGGG